jgi:exopolyphosphatase/guanosine-5'-triphosphate,3'-diphosphate pyrophosphatase
VREDPCYEQPAMRCAVIDIGTNTVKVLVADVQQGQVVPVMHKDLVTRLGEGVNECQHLSTAAMARTLQTVDEFLAESKAVGAVNIMALTTSACRDAVNRNEFFDVVREKCGLEVQLVSGDREAELIFRGVSSDPEWTSAPLVVIDVGGGSAEFIQGLDGKMELFKSLPLGALRLTEQFGEGRLAELRAHLHKVLQPALASYRIGNGQMIGTGGTISTFARMEWGAVDHVKISREAMIESVQRLGAMPLAERKKVPGLPADRADIIVAGGAVFVVAMELLGADELTVSVRSLRYGALLAG